MQFPNLTTNRLVLDDLKSVDAEALFRHFSNPDVVKFYDLEAFTDIDQANDLIDLFKRRFEEKSRIRWAIRLQKNNEFVGTCGLIHGIQE